MNRNLDQPIAVTTVEVTFQSIETESHGRTSEKVTLLGTGTGKGTKVAAQPQSLRQYVKDVFYVNLSQNRRKVKVEGVYVDVTNIYGYYIRY